MTQPGRDEPCPHCGRFANRGVSVDAVIVKDRQVLLVRRGVAPDKGFWGTPGGYVEWDESTQDALSREVAEETGLRVRDSTLVGVYSSPSRHPKQVINVVYLVRVEDGEPRAGDDAGDVRWFPLDSLPPDMAMDHSHNIADATALLRSSE